MLKIAINGGIGSGKSLLAHLMQERYGAVVVDADQIAREVLAPGSPGLAEVVSLFGDDIVDTSGALRRDRLAHIVFADDAARHQLNSVTHPRIAALAARRLAAVGDDRIGVYDVPLLDDNAARAFHLVVTVVADTTVRLERLAAHRGVDPTDARRRMAAQETDEQRSARSHYTLTNDATTAVFTQVVDAWWSACVDIAQARVRTGSPATAADHELWQCTRPEAVVDTAARQVLSRVHELPRRGVQVRASKLAMAGVVQTAEGELYSFIPGVVGSIGATSGSGTLGA